MYTSSLPQVSYTWSIIHSGIPWHLYHTWPMSVYSLVRYLGSVYFRPFRCQHVFSAVHFTKYSLFSMYCGSMYFSESIFCVVCNTRNVLHYATYEICSCLQSVLHLSLYITCFIYCVGVYYTGDGAYRHPGGYYQISGRMDDVVNVTGHRLGTAEVEDVLVRNSGNIKSCWLTEKQQQQQNSDAHKQNKQPAIAKKKPNPKQKKNPTTKNGNKSKEKQSKGRKEMNE